MLPPLQASVVPLFARDLLLLASDGIRSGFEEGLTTSDPPQQIADRILAGRFKGNDDALVLVVVDWLTHDVLLRAPRRSHDVQFNDTDIRCIVILLVILAGTGLRSWRVLR